VALPKARVPSEQESLGELVQRLRGDVVRILETEIRLVRVRVHAGLDAVRAAGMGFVAAMVLALAGVGALVAGFILVLATVIPAWIAALAVGGLLILVAGILTAVEIRVVRHGVNEAIAPVEPSASTTAPAARSGSAYVAEPGTAYGR